MGKSRFAGAIANHVNMSRKCTFFNVSSSDLLSVWQSESEKALKKLFSASEKLPCSIIFLDEVKEFRFLLY
jgi:SpoVK/Ycf46/Vps4 family AAA+-type ATPase